MRLESLTSEVNLLDLITHRHNPAVYLLFQCAVISAVMPQGRVSFTHNKSLFKAQLSSDFSLSMRASALSTSVLVNVHVRMDLI